MSNSDISVPFLDLVTPHLELEEQLVGTFRKALRGARFVGGEEVEGFEKDFAEFCSTEYSVGVGSGTDALRFALVASGVNPGDTVITVPNTFIATTEAITQAGAQIGFVDIDGRTYNMDPEKLREYLETRCSVDSSGVTRDRKTGSRVSAVVPVHLYGQMADMDPILNLADRYNLMVIEDACQAHGAEYFSKKDDCWKKAGSMGKAAAFSFYPGKNLGAMGEGGAVTTNDEGVAKKVRMIRDHGQKKKYFHEMEGYNGRLDAIQAAMLRIKLRHLKEWNGKRSKNAEQYNTLFHGWENIVPPFEPQWSRAVYHLYIIRSGNRSALQEYLSSKNIQSGLHYPVPLHLQKAYEGLGYTEGDFPITEKAAEEILSLPMFPGLTMEQQRAVADNVKDFVSDALDKASN